VIYEDPRPTFESAVMEQNAAAAKGKAADLQAPFGQGDIRNVAEVEDGPVVDDESKGSAATTPTFWPRRPLGT